MQDTYTDTAGQSGSTPGITSGIFDEELQAREAVDELRGMGLSSSAISVVIRGSESATVELDEAEDMEDPVGVGEGALTGAGVGAATGAVFGLASAAIPGAAPFIMAGVLANALGVTAAAAASGAIVGGSAGALAGAFSRLGLAEPESSYYADEVERGGVYVGVDLSQSTVDRKAVETVLHRHGGRTYS